MRRFELFRLNSRRAVAVAVITAAALIVLPGVVLACPPGSGAGAGERAGGPMMHLLRGLELDQAQREAVRTVMDDARPGIDAAHASQRAARDELRAATHTEPLDEAAIRTAAGALAAIEVDLAVGRAELLSRVRAELDDAQRAALAERLTSAGEGRGREHGERSAGRRGPRGARRGF